MLLLAAVPISYSIKTTTGESPVTGQVIDGHLSRWTPYDPGLSLRSKGVFPHAVFWFTCTGGHRWCETTCGGGILGLVSLRRDDVIGLEKKSPVAPRAAVFLCEKTNQSLQDFNEMTCLQSLQDNKSNAPSQ